MAAVDQDGIALTLGAAGGVRVGMVFVAGIWGEPIRNPATGEVLRRPVEERVSWATLLETFGPDGEDPTPARERLVVGLVVRESR